MTTTTIKKGQTLRKRRTGTIRQVAGFTRKPTPDSPAGEVQYARLIKPNQPESETRVRVDQILKTYKPI